MNRDQALDYDKWDCLVLINYFLVYRYTISESLVQNIFSYPTTSGPFY